MCVPEWLSVREGRRRAETESTKTSERELKMRRMNRVRLVRVLLFQPKWCILHPFFFSEFRHVSVVSARIGGFGFSRISMSWSNSARVEKKKKTGCVMNAQAVTSLTRCRVGHGCSGHFAASVHPKTLTLVCYPKKAWPS